MTGTHVTVGSALGALAAVLFDRYGIKVSSSDAALIGAGAAAGGVGLAHLVAGVGLIPALKQAVFGPPKPAAPRFLAAAAPPPPPAPPTA
jgi:hypothetical protein